MTVKFRDISLNKKSVGIQFLYFMPSLSAVFNSVHSTFNYTFQYWIGYRMFKDGGGISRTNPSICSFVAKSQI